MRKLATLSTALVASFAFVGAASAALTASIVGPNTPGTNTYSIVMSFGAGDGGGIRSIVSSVTTSGLYTGVFTDPALVAFPNNLGGPLSVPNAGGTGIRGSWGHGAAAPVAPGSYTVGTVEITVGVGDVVSNFMTTLDGFVTNSFYTVLPSSISGVTIIPEPTTGALLGLGIVGLVMAGRRSRA